MASEDRSGSPGGGYVERVRANTLAYIEEILEENARLRGQLDRAEAETRHFQDRFAEVEKQNWGLATLYAASYQLHASLRRADVLMTIQEIVINLIGSEELVILGVGRDGGGSGGPGGFATLASFGVDPAAIHRLRLDEGLLAQALARQEPIAQGGPDAAGVTSCIPLCVAGEVIALVVIFRLLPHKPALIGIDLELFALLGAHAANALHAAELHERQG